MIYGVRWQVYLVVFVILILSLAIFWPGEQEVGSPNQDFSSQLETNNATPTATPGKDSQSTGSANTPTNPFAKNNTEKLPMEGGRQLNSEPAKIIERKADETLTAEDNTDISNDPELPAASESTDWGKWRKSDDRLNSYLGGPPGPGSNLD